ncbi:universal stress protein [Mucilaginibacter psychrotolerans]|uniref:Universal stress protein n=1 Tax=Mucilaginibacter psychrotolerans TaxID=1524096 RepID=A0A4Y8SE29_9SPHI|nr:universal stress protein [Mucilaginibacter psychrotolerans]TFF37353.1 universal stress protein [Mucilaginibacter psychrotolerans]
MKKLLLLTDFSDHAEHAAENALYLCTKMQTALTIYHSFQAFPLVAYENGGPYLTEFSDAYAAETNERMARFLSKTKVFAEENFEGIEIPIEHISEDGDLGANLAKLLANADYELVIMGSGSSDYLDQLLGGSETQSVIIHSNRPILIIPLQSNLKQLKKVVFATDYNEKDFHAINYLVDMAGLLSFEIQVLHVDTFGDNPDKKWKEEVELKRFAGGLNFPGITYHSIWGKEVIPRLNKYCDESGADLLAMVHYHQGFFSKLFGLSSTRKEVRNQKQPLLIFPPKFI